MAREVQGDFLSWIDWMTGKLKTEFLCDLELEQMPYPGFEIN